MKTAYFPCALWNAKAVHLAAEHKERTEEAVRRWAFQQLPWHEEQGRTLEFIQARLAIEKDDRFVHNRTCDALGKELLAMEQCITKHVERKSYNTPCIPYDAFMN